MLMCTSSMNKIPYSNLKMFCATFDFRWYLASCAVDGSVRLWGSAVMHNKIKSAVDNQLSITEFEEMSCMEKFTGVKLVLFDFLLVNNFILLYLIKLVRAPWWADI